MHGQLKSKETYIYFFLNVFNFLFYLARRNLQHTQTQTTREIRWKYELKIHRTNCIRFKNRVNEDEVQ